MSASGRPSSVWSRRMWAAALSCSPWAPCEKFSLAASSPASTSLRTLAYELLAGPSVQTIFVRRPLSMIEDAFRVELA